MFFSGHTINSTSVPGPDHPISILGSPVSACRFAARNIIPVVSILSYNGGVYITLHADDTAIPGIDMLPKFYIKALVDLGKEFEVEIPQTLIDCIKD